MEHWAELVLEHFSRIWLGFSLKVILQPKVEGQGMCRVYKSKSKSPKAGTDPKQDAGGESKSNRQEQIETPRSKAV